MREKLIIVSGYFNPIQKGHIEYFHLAKKYADKLIVIINNDYQRQIKGSSKFMNEKERLFIVKELKVVDEVLLSIDNDSTVIRSISKIHDMYSPQYEIIFGNGGDQNNENIPEKNICEKLKIKLIDGLGSKIQSSSWLIKKNES